MFDQTPPQNLPVEDILAPVDAAPPPAPGGGPQNVPNRPRPEAIRPVALGRAGDAAPSGKRRVLLFGVMTLVLLVVFVGGGWFLLGIATKKQATAPATTPASTGNVPVAIPPVQPPKAPVRSPAEETPSTPVTNAPANIPPPIAVTPTPKDTDDDGLNDGQEVAIGTNPALADTDGDGANDFDEVRTWKSDPLNPDSDGDGYPDGAEVKNGYSPTGPGKIEKL